MQEEGQPPDAGFAWQAKFLAVFEKSEPGSIWCVEGPSRRVGYTYVALQLFGDYEGSVIVFTRNRRTGWNGTETLYADGRMPRIDATTRLVIFDCYPLIYFHEHVWGTICHKMRDCGGRVIFFGTAGINNADISKWVYHTSTDFYNVPRAPPHTLAWLTPALFSPDKDQAK